MAAYLGMPLQRFYKQYTQAYSKVLGFRLLKSKNNAVSWVQAARVAGASK
jgi:hypothetical protein